MGKFDSKRHKDLRDFKSKEIKKSLVHRARLRKNYFKLMDKEKQQNEEKEQREKAKMRPDNDNANQDVDDNSDKEESQEEVEDSQEVEEPQKVEEDPFERRKKLTYQERAKLIKERREEKRKQQIQYMHEKKEKIEKAKRQRERLNKKLSRTTKHGQPLMGPRITNLLDKIKQNQN